MNNLIEIANASKIFRTNPQNKTVLKDINLTVKSGEFIVLRGNNGTGKTTLLKIILGLLEPTTGSASLMGIPANFSESKREVGVVLQETQVPKNLTVRELVALFQSYYSSPLSTEEALDRVKLAYKQDSHATSLSGGQKQRLLFALALVGNPKLLILDEPTRNLDEEGYEEFWEQIQYLKEKGVAILMVTNNQADWEKLDRIADRFITLRKFQENLKEPQMEEFIPSAATESPSIESQSSVSTSSAENESPSTLKILLSHFKSEILQIIRTPLYLSFFVFPILLFFIADKLGETAKTFSIYTSCGFLIAFALQSLAGRISSERAGGWLKLIRSTPLPPVIYILSKMMTSFLLCLSVVTLILISTSLSSSNFSFGFGEFINLIVAFCLAALPILGFSLTVSYLVEPESVNTVNGWSILVISLAAGSLPLPDPEWVQDVIALSPIYHARVFIFESANLVNDNYFWLHFAWLVWASMAFLSLAVWAYRRDDVVQ